MRIEKLVVWHMRLELFSDVCGQWFCVSYQYVNVIMCESKTYAVAKVSFFQLTRDGCF